MLPLLQCCDCAQRFAAPVTAKVHLELSNGFCFYSQLQTPPCNDCQDVQPWLVDLGQKLQGVSNIVGHQMAVDEMADMLGIHIPQVGIMYIVKPALDILTTAYSVQMHNLTCSEPSSMPILQV